MFLRTLPGGARLWIAAIVTCGFVRPAAAAFVINSADPSFGVRGASIQIQGSGFSGGSGLLRVYFNNVLDSTTTAPSADTQINATVPPTATTGPIRIERSGGGVVPFTTTNDFVVVTNQPYIRWFDPVSGSTNANITLDGINLTTVPLPAIRFGGVLSPLVQNGAGQNQIVARIPANALPGSITASNSFGVFTTSSNFTVFGSGPQVLSFDPPTAAAGADVTVNGLNFIAGNTTVRFGGTNAPSVNVTAPSQLHVTVPFNAVTGPITVATPFGTNTTSTNFVFGLAPQIAGFTPVFGPVGTNVTIDGANFVTNGLRVSLNGSNIPPAKVTVVSGTQLRVTIHTGQTNGPFTVATIYGTNTTSTNFVVTGGAPVISDFTPQSGQTNTTIVLNGFNLIDVTNVAFGAVRTANFVAVSPTQISMKVPAHAISGPITAQNPYGSFTTSSNFSLPVIFTGLNPATAPIGVTFSLSGTNFTGASALRVNGTPTPFTFVNDRQIDVLVTASMVSGPVSLTTPAGTFVTTNSFIVQPSADLGITLALDRYPIAFGEIAGLVVTVTNLGPRTATNLVVSAGFPINFLQIGGTLGGVGGTVTTNESTMTADVALLGASNSFTFTLTARAIGLATNTASASVTSATPDGLQGNNVAFATLAVVNPPRLGLRLIETNVAQLYWPSNWLGFQLQTVLQLPAGPSWAVVTNPSFVSGTELRVQTAATNTASFFRLIR